MVADVVSIVQGYGHNDSGCYGRDGVDGIVDSSRVKVLGMISEYVYSNQHSTHCRLEEEGNVGGGVCVGGGETEVVALDTSSYGLFSYMLLLQQRTSQYSHDRSCTLFSCKIKIDITKIMTPLDRGTYSVRLTTFFLESSTPKV